MLCPGKRNGHPLQYFSLENFMDWACGATVYMQSQKQQNDLCSFPRKTIQYHGIQVYDLISNAKEVEVEWFYEDLQDLLNLTPEKDVLFIIGDWNAKVGSQETPGVTGKFGLGLQNEGRQRQIKFCQENALVIANTLIKQHKRRLYTGYHQMVKTKIRLITFSAAKDVKAL